MYVLWQSQPHAQELSQDVERALNRRIKDMETAARVHNYDGLKVGK